MPTTPDPMDSDYDITGICGEITCPTGKICVEDVDSEEGYKCCKNKKCVVKCKDPGTAPNATRLPDVRDTFKFSPKERVIFTCSDGFFIAGRKPHQHRQLECRADGNWSMEKPACYKLGDQPTYRAPNTTSTTTTNSTTTPVALNAGVFAILVPSIFLVVAVLLLVYLYQTRCRNHSHWEAPLLCRKTSRQIPPESTHPTMPDNLEEGAVLIKNFGQYVAIRHNNGDRIFHEEFEEIQDQSTKGFLCETSLLDENSDKNRYTNIVAYDHSRVHLLRGKKHRHHSGSSDYINANYVSSYEHPKAYIACQGPLPETFGDFWKMVWDNNVSVIVMITNLMEKGRRKCDQYWPLDGREQYKHFSVALRDEDVYANYTVRTFQLRDVKQSKRRSYNNERRVVQFHYTQWPDHGTPEYILPLLTFIRRSSQTSTDHANPIVVHCSAGVGRTGAYIMLHSMIRMADKTGKININKFLKFIRTQRNHLVQTEDQYIFLFDALLCHFICGNTECPGQQLKDYVENLIKPTHRKKPSPVNGVKTADTVDPKQVEAAVAKTRTGMENQFLIVARQMVRDIDYDFAKRSVNENKNRSNGILPVFRSRVPLNYRVGSEGSDYINASFLQGYRSGKLFIVTQLPMTSTRKDFWSLVWDHNCSVIITIRDSKWNDEEDCYWPTGDRQVPCPLFNVSAGSRSSETRNFGIFNVSTRGFVLEATKDDYVLSVTQIDINCWPTLEELSPDFTRLLNFVVGTTENKDGSIIVHDRFGATAAGQLACAHNLHQQLANENAVDVFQTVRVAYQMRPGIFKSHKDLHFLYKAMLLQTQPEPVQNRNGTHQPPAQASSSEEPPAYSENGLIGSVNSSEDDHKNEVAGTGSTKSSFLPDEDGSHTIDDKTFCDEQKEDNESDHFSVIDETSSAKKDKENDSENGQEAEIAPISKDTPAIQDEEFDESITTKLL